MIVELNNIKKTDKKVHLPYLHQLTFTQGTVHFLKVNTSHQLISVIKESWETRSNLSAEYTKL